MQVYIRPLRELDAQVSYVWRNDPEVWRYTGRQPDCRVTQVMEVEWIRQAIREKASHRFAICVEAGRSEEYVGNAYLLNVNAGSADYHIFIGDRSYWGKGVAKAATQLVLDVAFTSLSLDKVRLRVRREHTRAIRLYRSCGFVVVPAVDNLGDEMQEGDWQVMEIDRTSRMTPN